MISPTLIARQLPLVRVPVKSPVLTISGARGVLGDEFSEDDILELAQGGRMAELPWAWHVETRAARRMEVRILTECVTHYARTLGSRQFPELGESGALSLIVGPHWKNTSGVAPGGGPVIEARHFYKRMLFSQDLVSDLLAEGSLKTVRGSVARPGRGGSPFLTGESVVRFLKERRM